MKGSRFSEEQIIGVMREYEAGAKTEEVRRRPGSPARPVYKWKRSRVVWRSRRRVA